jgi:hypothetical protein
MGKEITHLSNVPEVPFVHYVVDFSLREITTAKGDKMTLCEIESNAPLNEDHGGGFFRWGRVVEVGKPIEMTTGCFCFILIPRCQGDMGVFAIAHAVPDDPTFQALIYDGDELIVAKPSDVSVGIKASFDFAWFNQSQRLRIETIPDFETFDHLRSTLLRKRGDA